MTGGVKLCTEWPMPEQPQYFRNRSAWLQLLMFLWFITWPSSLGLKLVQNMIKPYALAGGTSWKAWTSGRRISISFATRAGDAGRKPTAKIPSSLDEWGSRL